MATESRISLWMFLHLFPPTRSFLFFWHSCPSSIHPGIHPFIFQSVKSANCLYLFLYVRLCWFLCRQVSTHLSSSFGSVLFLFSSRFEADIFINVFLQRQDRNPECCSHFARQSKRIITRHVSRLWAEGSERQRSHFASIKRAVFN